LGSALHQTEAVCMLLLRLAGAKYHQVRMAGPTPPRVWAACVSVSASQAGRVSHAFAVCLFINRRAGIFVRRWLGALHLLILHFVYSSRADECPASCVEVIMD
jgi:hypothetical protein